MAKTQIDGVIFEAIRSGDYVRMTAVDTRSGIEATVVGPSRGGEPYLRQVALRKLRMLMEREGY